MRNPLKWVGGKSRIASDIVDHFPKGTFDYAEPFAGALNVYFEVHGRGKVNYAYLNDSCRPLVRFWKAIRNVASHFDDIVIPNNADEYASRRLDIDNPTSFWYVNRCGFNGLWRTNKDGRCNVPWEHGNREFRTSRYDYHEASEYLKRSIITAADYELSIQAAKSDSVLYCDPPYHGAFNGYDGSKSFDQTRLANALKECRARWFISTSDTLMIRDLYAGFRFIPIVTRYCVSADGYSRSDVTELLITNCEES